MIDDNEIKRSEHLRIAVQKTDIRSKKPEFRIILDVLQDVSPTTIQDLLTEINSTCGCEMFTYASLHHHINALRMVDAVKQDEITKEIIIESSQITKEIRYLPVSSYCVFTLGISVLFLIFSLYTNYMVIQTTTTVFVGTIYIAAQLFGNEFKVVDLMQRLKSYYTNLKVDKNAEKPIEPVTSEI